MCGSKKLKYFNGYSIDLCWLELLTKYCESKCGCKDHFMPGKICLREVPPPPIKKDCESCKNVLKVGHFPLFPFSALLAFLRGFLDRGHSAILNFPFSLSLRASHSFPLPHPFPSLFLYSSPFRVCVFSLFLPASAPVLWDFRNVSWILELLGSRVLYGFI